MTKIQKLEQEIAELKARLAALEARPMVVFAPQPAPLSAMPTPYPWQPTYQPYPNSPQYQPPYIGDPYPTNPVITCGSNVSSAQYNPANRYDTQSYN